MKVIYNPVADEGMQLYPDSTAGTGDVVGPASSTSGDIAIFDGTTGKLLKDTNNLVSYVTHSNTYTSTGSEPIGTTYYDTANHTLSTILEDGVVLQHGQELHIYGKNTSGSIIHNGDAVSLVTALGQWTAFGLTDATTAQSAYAFVGLATEELAINAFGYVTINGEVRDVNTNSLTEGRAIYVDPTTPGHLTSTFPATGNYIINVGMCEYKHAIHGRINVQKLIQPKLTDLSDIDGTPLTTTGQILVWNQTLGYWDANYNITNYLTTSTAASTYLKLDASNDPITGELDFQANSNTVSTKFVKGTSDTSDVLQVYYGANPNPVASISATGAATFSNFSGTNTGDVTLSSPNSGLFLTSQTLSLGTPSTLTDLTTNTVTTNTHTHAITGFLPLTGGALTGKLTLTVTNALTTGDYIGSYVSTTQSAASSGTTYAYKAEAYATHTSGTLAGLQANSTIANFTGSGGTTNYGEILTSNASVTNSAVVNTLSLVKVYTPTIHTGGSIGTLHGLYISNITGASSNYSIYSDGGSMYHAGAAVFGGTLSAPDLLVKSITDSTTTFQVQSSLSSVPILTVDTTNSRIGVLTSTPSTTLSFASEASRTIAIERRTTTNTAGNTLIIQAGGATLGATDKAGGTLALRTGVSTGTGTSSIVLQTYTPSTTGTTDNTLVTRATINNSGLAVAGILSLTPTTTTPNAVFTIGGTSDTANGTVMNVVTTLSGSGVLTGMAFRTGFSNVGTGATILGMDFGPNITSTTGTVTTMYGTLFLPRLETTSNVAVTNAYGMYLRLDNASTAGSVVTNFYGINIAGTSGSGTVTNKYTFCAGDNAGTWLIGDANNMMLGSTTGTKIGTATTEKLGFFNATPIVQPTNTTDLGTVLSNLGLRASGTAYPITTSGAVHFTGGVTIDTGNLTITDKDIVLSATTGTKIGTATTQKLGFFNATPIVQGTAFTQTYSTASHTHAAVTQLAAPAGGTGTAAGGWDTAANRNLAITSINAARTDIANVKQVLNALIDDLQALGLIA